MDNKTYLQYMISMNDFFRISNTNLVHSRINHLTELPVDELKMIIETEPLDVIKFNEIKMRINNIVDQNFELMMSPQNKMASIEQTIMLISQKEQDQEIINEVRNILYTQNDDKDYLTIRKELVEQKKSLNENNNLNVNNLPLQEEDNIKEQVVNEQQPVINDSFSQSQQVPNINQNIEQPQQNNSFHFQPDNQQPTTYENPLNQYNDENVNKQSDIPVIENGKTLVKTLNPQTSKRVMVDSSQGFIKTGTIVLFGLSFILTIISLVLLIAS